MTFKKLEEIEVWKRGMKLAREIYTLTTNSKFDRDWSLRDQMRRAAVSIPSNIAEGYERASDGDFNRFVLIAKGSCGELRTQILIAIEIGYLSEESTSPLIMECLALSSMLGALSRHLENKISARKGKSA